MPISSRLLHDIENNYYKEEVLNLIPHAGLNEDVLCDEDIIELSHALAKNKHIKKINLSYNKIGDKGLEALANVETIEEVDFSNGLDGYDDVYNDITPAGLLSLTKSHLKKLILSGNRRVGDEGLKILAKNQTIVELDVSDCSITSAGVKEFFETNTTVVNLKLGSNDITDEGLQTVKLNQVLRELDLTFCNITSAGLAELTKNKSLLKVVLYETNIKETDLVILTECYFKIGRKLAFTRTEEDIIKYFSKKSPDIISHDTNSGNTSPVAASSLFTPTYTATIPSTPPDVLGQMARIAQDQLPANVAKFICEADLQKLQAFQEEFRKVRTHSDQYNSGQPLAKKTAYVPVPPTPTSM